MKTKIKLTDQQCNKILRALANLDPREEAREELFEDFREYFKSPKPKLIVLEGGKK